MRQFIKDHYLAIIFSILIGFLMVLPQFIFMIKMGDNYAGVNILNIDAETNYLSRFQEISEGDWGLKDVFWTFNGDQPYQRPHLGQLILYRLGRIFFLDVSQIFLLTKFILPLILFLSIYFFVLSFKQDKKIALVSAAGLMLWYGISSASELSAFLANSFVIPRYSIFSRPIIPVFGMIILFSFLSSFYSYLGQSKKKHFWLAGILLGLSFYIYFFTWSFLVVFILSSLFWFWFRRDWLKLKKIIWITLLGLLIALPYWFNFYKLATAETFNSFTSLVGVTLSNSMIIGKYLILALVLYLLGLWTKRIKGQNLWLWSLIVFSFIAILNQQLITQRIVQPGHYHWYVIKPLVIVFFIWLVFDLVRKKSIKFFNFLLILFILTGFYLVISQEIFVYNEFKEETLLHSQQYGPAYQWIKENTQKNQIYFAGTLENKPAHLISCYVQLDEYLYKSRYLNPPLIEDNKLTMFFEYRLDKITPEMTQELFFNEKREEIFLKIYDYYRYRLTYLEKDKLPTDEEVQKVVDQYREFYQKDLEEEFRKHPIDYIIWDKNLHPQWNLDNYRFLEPVYQGKDVSLYQFL